jgi:CRISPR/Cas system CSM-associated protein Csm3 (group 7 of RAMP superfamily)
MPDRIRVYSLSFEAPVGVFTGLGVAGLVDRTVVRGASGLPEIPGSTVKGRLRFFAERLLRAGAAPAEYRIHPEGKPHCKRRASACTACRLFGNASLPSPLRIGPATPAEPWRSIFARLLAADPNPVVHPDVDLRPGIALSRSRRTVLADHLFFDETVPASVRFEGSIWICDEVTPEEERFLIGAGRLVDALGARKAAGRGRLHGGVEIAGEAT